MPKSQRAQLVYEDTPTLKAAAHERRRPPVYGKMTSRTKISYLLMDVSSCTITLEEIGIPSTIFIHRTTPMPSSTKQTTLKYKQAPLSLIDSAANDCLTENKQQLSPMNYECVV